MNVTITAEPARCLGCRRVVRSAGSIATGYGRACRAKMRHTVRTADLSAWTAAQIEDAQLAVTDGAIVPGTREGVFHVVSSDGAEVYRTHRHGCTCANGMLARPARPCWHRAAVGSSSVSPHLPRRPGSRLPCQPPRYPWPLWRPMCGPNLTPWAPPLALSPPSDP